MIFLVSSFLSHLKIRHTIMYFSFQMNIEWCDNDEWLDNSVTSYGGLT